MKIFQFNSVFQVLVVSFFFSISRPIFSRSMMEQSGDLEIDWGRLKIRFAGESFISEQQPVYDKQVTEAISSAILEHRQKIIDYHKSYLIDQKVDEKTAETSAIAAADAVATSTYPYHTEYFFDGVKVYLENSLTKALQRGDLKFKPKEQQESEAQEKFSGIVLRTKGKIKPRPSYMIVDETGKTLFQAGDVKKEAFEKNFMGRWLIKPTRDELQGAVGAQPLSISFEEDDKGRFTVQGQAWFHVVAEGQGLLRNAKIAIVSGD